ncbi:PilW family protein [Rhodanobacter sp. MP1X3]|uniref:PilW family protein n=1 Tax=Rhodanobacter sp. MP1X3 TaxID=2723086 RepID=UPI00161C7023|nr:type IV pilus assembly protein PilW [Rhodanobacter sp. MP1X3]
MRTRSRGFSLIELMVGIVVSIICTLAIMAAFAVYEGHKRTTSSGDDAQQNGSYSLYALERQIRSAGSGLVQGSRYSVLGCAINAASGATALLPATSLPAPFATSGWPLTTLAFPVLIAGGGATTPDVIGVISGNPAQQVFKVGVTSTTATTVVVGNSFGFLASDYVLGTMPNGSCTIGQLAATPNPIPTTTTTLTLNTATSPSTGLTNAVNLFDLGRSPIFTLFGVDPATNSLVSFDLLQRATNGGAGTIPIADGIVQLKTLYGIHDGTGPSGEPAFVVDNWVQPVGTTWGIAALTANTAAAQAAIAQIKAIRVAVVAQSRLPERSTDYVGKTTLTLFPDLASTLQYSITTQTQFRYKVYDTTIPIHNALVTQTY